MPRPTGLIQQLDEHLHRSRILTPADRLLIACSGGADSVALTHLLAAVSQSNYWHWKLRLVHVNHRTRPGENDRDEVEVRRLARRLGIPLTISRLRPAAKPRNENQLRQLRWAKFVAAARRYHSTCIVTAHHANDQAETMIMRLLRGSGVRGLGAIRPVRRHGSLKIVRPMLQISKQQLMDYLTVHGIPWCEDSTNTDTRYLRNHVRHHILPSLVACQPQIVSVLVNTAAQMRHTQRLINRQVRLLCDELGIRNLRHPPRSINRGVLRLADTVTAMEFLRRWLMACGIPADRLGHKKVNEIYRLVVQRPSNLTVHIADAASIVISREEIRFNSPIKRKSIKVHR